MSILKQKHLTWSSPAGIKLVEYVLGTLLEQDPPSPADSSRSSVALRSFTVFWLMFTLLISTAYRSKLVTFLAFPNIEQPPESFEALAHSDYKIGLQYIKGAAYQVLKHSKNPTYAKIFKRMSLEENDVNCFLAAVKARFACISWDSIAEFVKHRDLSDAHGQSPVVKSPSSTLNINAGLVMEKRAVFKEEIDNVLRWATDTGVILKIRRLDFQDIRIQRHAWFQGEDKKSNKSTRGHVGTGALNLSQLSGCLYIFLGCIVLAGMSFLAEHVVNCSIMKRNQTIFIN
ncbi:Glutamate receptor 3 [Folsomia candida]|uniref:Glutamate receptor 3 n=1 Tax=Folsomia candida TaxID=158441 RepID=A0A226D3P7_FOLCA|nr:Glutamate receptor 3 [Folsomia candida]